MVEVGRGGVRGAVQLCSKLRIYITRTLIVVPVNVLVYTYIGRIGPARIPALSTYLGWRDHWD